MKFKSLPDCAALVARLTIGLAVLIQFGFSIQSVLASVSSSTGLLIVFIVLALGSILLVLGLFTRWAAAAIILYYIVSGIMYAAQGQPFLIMLFSLVTSLAPYAVIFLLGGGKYSLDQKITNRKNRIPAQM